MERKTSYSMEDLDSLYSVIDSLNYIIDNKSKDFEKLYDMQMLRTIISSSVIIILFIVERLINFLLNKKAARRKWIEEVIIKPNLTSIIDFYDTSFKHIENSLQEIRNLSNTNSDQIDELKQEKLIEFKKQKKDFDHKFISLVRSSSNLRAECLTNCLNNLEDIVTNCLSTTNLAGLDLQEKKREVHLNKSSFFGLLHETEKKLKKLIKNAINS